ncbi:hypothetical protein [Paenibacillus sp. FSL R7-0337]|uniref:hypothetical protein n=1 Tax=Paenibacillus sp. FSL R7-0337 TaxID=1926588 RepID=UPI00096C3AE1|nr:hypothetical protein [Paenibacillus sp. FSL R7-0337]OMF88759.1 hypothetical protein BK147_26505 [Paenibacillus sp. FSL R7-0337]
MRKQLITLAILTLATSLFSTSAFAAEVQPKPIESTQPVQAEVEVQAPQVLQNQITSIRDNTSRIVTDGIHVDISYPPQAFVPDFKMELWSVTDNKLISSAIGNNQNFDRTDGVYHLIFNHSGYKLGDQFAIILRKADGIINNLRFQDDTPDEKGQLHYYDLKVNTNYQFKIASFNYFDGVEGEETTIKDLTATSIHPIKANLQTNSQKVGLFLQTEDGSPLKKTLVEIKLFDKKGTISSISDENGMVWLDNSKLTWRFSISSQGKSVKDGVNGKGEIELPQSVITGSQKQAVTIPVVFENPVTNSEITVNFSPVDNTELSTAWSDVEIVITSLKGVSSTYSLNLENNTISGLPDGTYKVAVKGKYATAKINANSLKIIGGRASINISLKARYTLEVNKEGKRYNFSIINVDSVANKKYKGKESLVFGVTPGESFLIKDNDTGKVETVFIDPKSERAKFILGMGIVLGGGVSIPHTGVDIPDTSGNPSYLWLGFVLSVMGAVISFVFYRRRKQKCHL